MIAEGFLFFADVCIPVDGGPCAAAFTGGLAVDAARGVLVAQTAGQKLPAIEASALLRYARSSFELKGFVRDAISNNMTPKDQTSQFGPCPRRPSSSGAMVQSVPQSSFFLVISSCAKQVAVPKSASL